MTDHVVPEVYDAHEAFEIDKTKMKMLVPLDMNGKKIMNTNYDLKFGDLFKVIKCYVSLANRYRFFKKVIIKFLFYTFQLFYMDLLFIIPKNWIIIRKFMFIVEEVYLKTEQ